MEWYRLVLQRYAEFSGRSRRREYWMYLVINLAIYFVLYVAGLVMFFSGQRIMGVALFAIYGLYALATLIPSLAVAVRRLHDIGKSGWWILISLVPLVGGIILIVLLAMDGTPGPNQYGPSPKFAGLQPAAIA